MNRRTISPHHVTRAFPRHPNAHTTHRLAVADAFAHVAGDEGPPRNALLAPHPPPPVAACVEDLQRQSHPLCNYPRARTRAPPALRWALHSTASISERDGVMQTQADELGATALRCWLVGLCCDILIQDALLCVCIAS